MISGFSFVRHLGSGGFADVFLYQELWFDRLVAIKVLSERLSDEAVRRFIDEANVLARLSNHPSIVTVHRAGISDDARPYLVMEYCSQPNLEDRYRVSPLSESEALSIGIEIAGAVEAMHRAGLLHRDIKPANILTTDYGRPALADFGIAAAIGTDVHAMSVPWAPPELFTAGACGDQRGDVYSLAATLYTVLAGRTPLEQAAGAGQAPDLVERIRTQPVPPIDRADVSDGMQTALAQAMAKSPDHRYPSAAEFGRALQRVQIALGPSQPYPDGPALPQIPDRRQPAATQLPPRVTPSPATISYPTPPTVLKSSVPPPASMAAPVPSRSRRAPTAIIAAAAVILALAVTIGVVLLRPWSNGEAAQPEPGGGAATSSTPSPAPSAEDRETLDLPVGPAIGATQLLVPRYKKLTPPGELWLVDTADPTLSRQVDAVLHGSPFGIGISPDRRTITYIDAGLAVRAMPAAGGNGRLLFDSPAGCGRISHKAWSPTDQSVFVLECQPSDGPRELVVVDIDGTVVRKLDTSDLQPSDPAISPDGKTIAFCGTLSDTSEEGGAIYVMPLDGSSDPRAVTESPEEADSDAQWSPDGESLAFRRRVGPPRGEKFNADSRLSDHDIMTVAARGGTPKTLVSGAATDNMPTWSPDGRTIAFISNRDGNGNRTESKDIWLVPADGGEPAPLGLTAPRYATPAWTTR